MSNEIRHSSATKPVIIPWNEDTQLQNIDRVQAFSGGANQPKEFVYEAGRLRKVCTDKKILESVSSLTQLEFGEIDFYLALANKASLPSGGLELEDFDGSLFDILTVGKDKAGGTMEQTVLLRKQSLKTIKFDIKDPESRIERSFDFAGDFFEVLKSTNKIFLEKIYTVPSGYSADPYSIVINDPAPVVDPNVALKYIQRVLRVRSNVTTELIVTTDYNWTNGTTALDILSATTGDIIKVAYEAGSFGTGGDYTAQNDVDLCYINADSVKVTLQSGAGTEVELDKLTSLNITATLNRLSEGVVGLKEKLLKNVKEYDVKVALNGRVKDATIEDVLMGQGGINFPVIDPNFFKDDVILRVYVYTDSTKTSFKIGYKAEDLGFDGTTQNANANDFWTETINLSSDNLLISDVELDLA